MASSKIKKKTTSAQASRVPRQAAVPCLVLIALILLVLGLFIFFGLRSTG